MMLKSKILRSILAGTIVLVSGVLFSVLITSPKASNFQISQNLGIGESTPQGTISVAITNPTNYSQVNGVVPIEAEATSSSGVTIVTFEVDGMGIASDSASPYTAEWDSSAEVPGSWHYISATAYDNAGLVASSATQVQIAGVIPTPTPSPTPTPTPTPSPTPSPTPIPAPVVSITYPLNGAAVKRGASVNITASASDVLGISKVEFYVNNSLKCNDSTAAYTCSWGVPKGSKTTYTITAKAYSISGLTGQSSVVVNSY